MSAPVAVTAQMEFGLADGTGNTNPETYGNRWGQDFDPRQEIQVLGKHS